MAPLPTSRDELAGARREGAERKRWRGGSHLALSLREKDPALCFVSVCIWENKFWIEHAPRNGSFGNDQLRQEDPVETDGVLLLSPTTKKAVVTAQAHWQHHCTSQHRMIPGERLRFRAPGAQAGSRPGSRHGVSDPGRRQLGLSHAALAEENSMPNVSPPVSDRS
jgi:hypothetical protein